MPDNLFPEEYENEEEYFEDEENEGTEEENTEEEEDAGYKPSIFFDFDTGDFVTLHDGKLKEAVILSKAGEPCNLRYGNLTFTFKTTKGKTYKVMVENEKLKKIPL